MMLVIPYVKAFSADIPLAVQVLLVTPNLNDLIVLDPNLEPA
jgi:hypothetical protein